MKGICFGGLLLALVAHTAYAQDVEPRKFEVFFAFDDATLTTDGAQVVTDAAEEYQRTGAARVAVTGHTDRPGSSDYDLALSERRVDAVTSELVRLGVPASVIAGVGDGESDPLVQTADGVREAENRRVEIEVAQPAPVPGPVAVVPEAGPPPAPLWAASLGGLYGNNFRETDDDTTSALAGVEGRVEYL